MVKGKSTAMSPKKASKVKRRGHKRESQFAKIIGGRATRSNYCKTDVLDKQGKTYSVKTGNYWQIILFGKNRLSSDIHLREIGNISKILVNCTNVFPEIRSEYKKNKQKFKKELQPHMRALLRELKKTENFKKFLLKSIFENLQVDYLTVNFSSRNLPANKKVFHIFHRNDVISAILDDVTLQNSVAKNSNQMSDLKVILKSKLHNLTNIGEIEIRTDTKNFRRLKFRLHGAKIFNLLREKIDPRTPDMRFSNLVVYGTAKFHIKKLGLKRARQI